MLINVFDTESKASKVVVPAAVGVVSFGFGVAAGFSVSIVYLRKKTKKNLTELEEYVEEEISKIRAEYASFNLESETQIDSVDPDQESMNFDPPEVSEVSHSRRRVFQDQNEPSFDNWDYEVELRARALNGNTPYVIHKDEFEDNESGYSQTTLTYYKGDDILTDEHDVPIYNQHTVVGTDLPFGRGSGDPNVLYVRNERLNAEYEILLDNGRYAVEILGHVEEDSDYEDNSRPKVQKFREE